MTLPPSPGHCPKCSARGDIIESRAAVTYRRRRYKCPDCKSRWTTSEVAVHPKRIARFLQDERVKARQDRSTDRSRLT